MEIDGWSLVVLRTSASWAVKQSSLSHPDIFCLPIQQTQLVSKIPESNIQSQTIIHLQNVTFDLCERKRRKTEKAQNRNRNRAVSQSSKEELVASKWNNGILNYIKREKKKNR